MGCRNGQQVKPLPVPALAQEHRSTRAIEWQRQRWRHGSPHRRHPEGHAATALVPRARLTTEPTAPAAQPDHLVGADHRRLNEGVILVELEPQTDHLRQRGRDDGSRV